MDNLKAEPTQINLFDTSTDGSSASCGADWVLSIASYPPNECLPRITIGFSSNIHIWENEKKIIFAAWIEDLLYRLHRFW